MNKIFVEGPNEYVLHEKLPNGLDVYMLPNNKVQTYYLTFSAKFGSIITDFKFEGDKSYKHIPAGVAHTLEHLTFYTEDGDASTFYANNGAKSNAYTSTHITCYEVFGYNKFKENLEYLLDYVQTPYYTEKMVNDEKGIITEEIKMYEDDPESVLMSAANECLYVNDNRKNLVTGTKNDVKKTTVKDIELAYNTFYYPANMFVCLTGNFNPDEALAIIEENQAKKTFKEQKKIIVKKIREPKNVACSYKEIKKDVSIPKTEYALKIPLSSFTKAGINEQTLLTALNIILNMNFGSTSLFREQLVDGNIINDDLVYYASVCGNYLVIEFLCETHYPKRFASLLEEKLNNLIIDEEEFNSKKRVAISNLILVFEDIERANEFISSGIIKYNEVPTYLYDVYNSLNISTLKNVCKKINTKVKTIVVVKENNKTDQKKK